MKIIVTGGSGFIGRNLISLLLKKKFKVLNIDKGSYVSKAFKYKKTNNKNYYFHKINLNNTKQINFLLNEFKPDKIINLAAESHVDNSILNSDEFINSNILGTYNLLQETLKYWEKKINSKKKKIYFSSCFHRRSIWFSKFKRFAFY